MDKEHRTIVAVVRPERLKIVRFLLGLAQWQVVDCPHVEDAVNLIRNTVLNGRCYEALVLFDFSALAATPSDRVQVVHCLKLCTDLAPGLPIIIAENMIAAQERKFLNEVLGRKIECCSVECLAARLEEQRTNAVSLYGISDHGTEMNI